MAGNATDVTPSGSGPAETSNSSNSSGLMPALPASAVHTISDTASVTVPSSVVIGVASAVFVTVAVQPAFGLVLTNASGWSVGSLTSSLTVLASSRSVGTRNASLA